MNIYQQIDHVVTQINTTWSVSCKQNEQQHVHNARRLAAIFFVSLISFLFSWITLPAAH